MEGASVESAWMLNLQRSTTSAFECLLGCTGVVVWAVAAVEVVSPDAAALELAWLDVETALTASAVVLTEAEEFELEELPQPATPTPARITTVTHIEGMRRNLAPLL